MGRERSQKLTAVRNYFTHLLTLFQKRMCDPKPPMQRTWYVSYVCTATGLHYCSVYGTLFCHSYKPKTSGAFLQVVNLLDGTKSIVVCIFLWMSVVRTLCPINRWRIQLTVFWFSGQQIRGETGKFALPSFLAFAISSIASTFIDLSLIFSFSLPSRTGAELIWLYMSKRVPVRTSKPIADRINLSKCSSLIIIWVELYSTLVHRVTLQILLGHLLALVLDIEKVLASIWMDLIGDSMISTVSGRSLYCQ